MGMDPATATLIGTIAAPAIGGMFAPEGQELSSFAGRQSMGTSIDPGDLMGQLARMISGNYQTALDRASQPVTLSAARPSRPPGYSGGHLPFRIGVTSPETTLNVGPGDIGSGFTGDMQLPDGVYTGQRGPTGGSAGGSYPEYPEGVRTATGPTRLRPTMPTTPDTQSSNIAIGDTAQSEDPTQLSLNLLQSAARRRAAVA